MLRFLFQDYGELPKYINHRTRLLERSREIFNDTLQKERQFSKPVKMSEETKKEIFDVQIILFIMFEHIWTNLYVVTRTTYRLAHICSKMLNF